MIAHEAENQFDQIQIRSHGSPAIVHQDDNLDTISQFSFKDQFDFPAVSAGAINGLIHIQFGQGACRCHVLQGGEDLAEIFGSKGGAGGIIDIAAALYDLEGRAMQ